jgi:hypothetical protein
MDGQIYWDKRESKNKSKSKSKKEKILGKVKSKRAFASNRAKKKPWFFLLKEPAKTTNRLFTLVFFSLFSAKHEPVFNRACGKTGIRGQRKGYSTWRSLTLSILTACRRQQTKSRPI